MSIRDELIRIVADADADIDERPFPDRIVDAILARYAVVELPEPSDDRWTGWGDGTEGCDMHGWDIGDGLHYVSVWDPNEVQMSYDGNAEEPFNPEYARALAAALLAAANRAAGTAVSDALGIIWNRNGDNVTGTIVRPNVERGGLDTVGSVTYTLEQAAKVAGQLIDAIGGKQ